MNARAFDATQGGLLIPKRSYVARRPFFATYMGATLAVKDAQIAADLVAYNGMVAQRDAQAALAASYLANYNALSGGLTDQLTVAAINMAAVGRNGLSVDSATVTLTIPKTGHYHVGVYARATSIGCGGTASQPNGTCTVAGTAGVSDTAEFYRAANTPNSISSGGYGWYAHGLYSAGQTVTFRFHVNDIDATMTGNISAHWVPTTANPS